MPATIQPATSPADPTRPPPEAGMRAAKVFWFHSKPNFGDALAPLLLARFSGLRAEWAFPAGAQVVVIGSIADRLPGNYRGVVAGIGKLKESTRVDLSRAVVLALRGELTLRDSGARGDIALGDPGLLAAKMLDERPEQLHQLGIVPHRRDKNLAVRYPDALRINVGQSPLEVIRAIATCERIVSSSLHGLIAADALGLPRRWEICPEVWGGSFKYRDYSSALGRTIEPDQWAAAPAAAVDRRVSALLDVFREIPAALANVPRPPNRIRQYLQYRARRAFA